MYTFYRKSMSLPLTQDKIAMFKSAYDALRNPNYPLKSMLSEANRYICFAIPEDETALLKHPKEYYTTVLDKIRFDIPIGVGPELDSTHSQLQFDKISEALKTYNAMRDCFCNYWETVKKHPDVVELQQEYAREEEIGKHLQPVDRRAFHKKWDKTIQAKKEEVSDSVIVWFYQRCHDRVYDFLEIYTKHIIPVFNFAGEKYGIREQEHYTLDDFMYGTGDFPEEDPCGGGPAAGGGSYVFIF
jgi:hypothetical protein